MNITYIFVGWELLPNREIEFKFTLPNIQIWY